MDHYSTCDCLWLLHGLVNLCKKLYKSSAYTYSIENALLKSMEKIENKSKLKIGELNTPKNTLTPSTVDAPTQKEQRIIMLMYYGQLIKTNSPSKCLICRPMQMKFMKTKKHVVLSYF